jgi:hypothetical protein
VLTGEDVSLSAAELLCGRHPAFGPITEDLSDQFPLHVAQVVVTGPRDDSLVACGAHPDFVRARHGAILRAVELHATLTAGAPPVEVAAGLSWAASLEAGLLAHCLEVTMSRIGGGPFPTVDVSDVALDEVGSRYRELTEMVGLRVVVSAVSNLPGVPAFAFSVGSRTIAYTAGLTPAEAIRDGLEQVLLAFQARFNPRPAYAPPPVPPLPALGLAARPGRSAPAPPPADRRKVLQDALRSAGQVATAVPLDHDRVVLTAVPHVLRVVRRRIADMEPR